MTDIGMTAPGTAGATQPPIVLSRQHVTGSRMLLTVVGLAAGVVGFIGFFVNFFSSGGSNMSSSGSGWLDLVPIFIGLGVIGLFMPRMNYFFSGLPLISLGICFGIRGLAPGFIKLASSFSGNAGSQLNSALGYGTGFWMITVGSGVLTLCALMIIGNELRGARA